MYGPSFLVLRPLTAAPPAVFSSAQRPTPAPHAACSSRFAHVSSCLRRSVAQGCHNMLVDAGRRVFAQAGTSTSRELHVKQHPQRLRAAGLPALPSWPTCSSPCDRRTASAPPTTSALFTSSALAVPLTPYSTQGAPHPLPPRSIPRATCIYVCDCIDVSTRTLAPRHQSMGTDQTLQVIR